MASRAQSLCTSSAGADTQAKTCTYTPACTHTSIRLHNLGWFIYVQPLNPLPGLGLVLLLLLLELKPNFILGTTVFCLSLCEMFLFQSFFVLFFKYTIDNISFIYYCAQIKFMRYCITVSILFLFVIYCTHFCPSRENLVDTPMSTL